MKSCFSTLGCPDWTAEQVTSCVSRLGFAGIELRGLEGEMFLPDSPHLQPGSEFLRQLSSAGCQVVDLGSSACFARGGEALDECNAFVKTAQAAGCGMVRVFGGQLPQGADHETAARDMAPLLRQACEFAAPRDVAIGLETHDAWCRGDECALILDAVDHPALGIVWDAHHSYRHGEAPRDTVAAIGERIVHVHLKDVLWSDKGPNYRLLGEGDVPLLEILQVLKDQGYGGYLSLEWEKKWHPQLEAPEVAFPQYVSKLDELLGCLA